MVTEGLAGGWLVPDLLWVGYAMVLMLERSAGGLLEGRSRRNGTI